MWPLFHVGCGVAVASLAMILSVKGRQLHHWPLYPLRCNQRTNSRQHPSMLTSQWKVFSELCRRFFSHTSDHTACFLASGTWDPIITYGLSIKPRRQHCCAIFRLRYRITAEPECAIPPNQCVFGFFLKVFYQKKEFNTSFLLMGERIRNVHDLKEHESVKTNHCGMNAAVNL